MTRADLIAYAASLFGPLADEAGIPIADTATGLAYQLDAVMAATADDAAPDDAQKARLTALGYHDLTKIYQTEDLAPGEQILLSCSGVTNGELLHGVRFFGGGSRTHTLFMSLARKMIRFVDTIHREDLSTPAYFDV